MQDTDWSQSISKQTWSKPLQSNDSNQEGARFVVEDDADEKIHCWHCLRRNGRYFKMKGI